MPHAILPFSEGMPLYCLAQFIRKVIMKYFAKILLIIILSIILLNCSSSDSDDNDSSNALQKNACGTLGLNTRIIDGTACSESGSPVVKIVVQFTDGTEGLCSGTMITTDDVLTAAHCFFNSVASGFVEINSQRVAIKEIINHPEIGINEENLAVFNDVAIVRLQSPLAVPILPILSSRGLQSGDIISIYGYGLDNQGETDTLRSGEMRVGNVSANHIFAPFNGVGSNTCNGDSGGPAIYSFNSADGRQQNAIAGIVSTGRDISCQAGDITLFTNIQSPAVINFILNNVPEAGLA